MTEPLDHAEWAGAKYALSLAQGEMDRWVLSAPYGALPPELAELRRAFDRAKARIADLQRQREAAKSPYLPPSMTPNRP